MSFKTMPQNWWDDMSSKRMTDWTECPSKAIYSRISFSIGEDCSISGAHQSTSAWQSLQRHAFLCMTCFAHQQQPKNWSVAQLRACRQTAFAFALMKAFISYLNYVHPHEEDTAIPWAVTNSPAMPSPCRWQILRQNAPFHLGYSAIRREKYTLPLIHVSLTSNTRAIWCPDLDIRVRLDPVV